mgnify:CR=1 FL=1
MDGTSSCYYDSVWTWALPDHTADLSKKIVEEYVDSAGNTRERQVFPFKVCVLLDDGSEDCSLTPTSVADDGGNFTINFGTGHKFKYYAGSQSGAWNQPEWIRLQ